MADSHKQSPVVRERYQAIVVGVTDLRELHQASPPPLPQSEVTVRLHDGDRTLSPSHIKQMPGPRVAARFEAVVAKTTYQATAYRRQGSEVVATALPKPVKLGRGQRQAAVDLELHYPPVLKLIEAQFEGDHAVITAAPPTPKPYTQLQHPHPRKIMSSWGDGSGLSLKPEYRAPPQGNELPNNVAALWNPASYSKGQTAKLVLKLRVTVRDQRSHTLEEVRLSGGPGPLTFVAKTAIKLVDGATIELHVQADEPLPASVEHFDISLTLEATADQHPVRIEQARHWLQMFVTLDKPGGKAKMHAHWGPGELFPEQGPTQKITPKRLEYAVQGGLHASDYEQAVRKLFDFVEHRGIGYYGSYKYPPTDAPDNTTGMHPMPPLHDFLWIAMAERNICHCLDLAAGFRLLARAVGVQGGMDVKECFPWPPWDAQGDRRNLEKDGEPWQASLSKYVIADASKLVFLDGNGAPNAFEAVLRYQPPGSKKRILLPIGEQILDAYGPDVKPGPMDDRNASLFFQASNSDKWRGKFSLAVKKPGGKLTGYRKPPFGFMTHDNQVRFKFHYDVDTIEPGDE